MIDQEQRKKDILSVISHLDISPTMYENAVSKYNAVASYLNDHGVSATIYPQGSFAYGTVVRPVSNDPEANYDLDVICQIKGDKSEHSPSELRKTIEQALQNSGVYAEKIEIYDECITIVFADVDGIGFSIDIVPATDETQDKKTRLALRSDRPDLLATSIAIPERISAMEYEWLTNNPKGFCKWFNEINAPYLALRKEISRRHLFERYKKLYASVEEVPTEMERSALQRVIQIFKHHRNVFYSKFKDGDEIKPISAIITTIIAKIAQQTVPTAFVFELLEKVVSELRIYSEHQKLEAKEFRFLYGERSVISRNNGKWFISNPANPEDNLANRWNENSRIPEMFFRWINAVEQDLISSLSQVDDYRFGAAIDNGFGRATVSCTLGEKYRDNRPISAINSATAGRPYRTK